MTIEVRVAIGSERAQGPTFGFLGHSDFGFDSGFELRSSDLPLGSEDNGKPNGCQKPESSAEPEWGRGAEQTPKRTGKQGGG